MIMQNQVYSEQMEVFHKNIHITTLAENKEKIHQVIRCITGIVILSQIHGVKVT